MSPKIDPEAVTAIIAETAAEIIMPRFQKLASEDIQEKSPGELVTIADELSEVRLSQRLSDTLPGSLVVGEEAVAKDPTSLAILGSDEPVWIIDPLDGTSNFAKGKAAFAVIIALVQNARVLAGWIHNPTTGQTAVTETGAGAFLAGQRMQVSRGGNLTEMRAIITKYYFKDQMRQSVERLIAQLALTEPFSCAGLAYIDLCNGEAEIATPARLRPWDHAAGALMHKEAGGANAMVDGQPYSPLVDTGLFIVAPDQASWSDVQRIFTGPFADAT